MRELVRATVGVLRQRFTSVIVVTIAISLPGQILIEGARGSSPISREISLGGQLLTNAANLTLVLILLRNLQSKPLPRGSIVPSVVTALLRLFGVLMILVVPTIVVVLPLALIFTFLQGEAAAATIVMAGTIVLEVIFAPIALIVPVSLNEDIPRPWPILKRAWAMSRPRRGQTRLFLGGLAVLTLGASELVRAFGPAPSAAVVLVYLVSGVLNAGVIAVLYHSLIGEELTIAAHPN
jgi:hypothetical protein